MDFKIDKLLHIYEAESRPVSPCNGVYFEFKFWSMLYADNIVLGGSAFYKHSIIRVFLHYRWWISPWIKSISIELNTLFTWSHHNCLVFVTSSAISNKIIYLPPWRTISVLTRVIFWCLFPSLLRNSRNTQQNNITLSWALKQFVTWVHALFPIYPKNYAEEWLRS